MRSASTQVEQGASEGALGPTDGHPQNNHNKLLQRSRVTSSARERYLVCSFVLEAGGRSLSHARTVGSSQTQHPASGLHVRVQSLFLRGRFQPSTVHLRSSGCHSEAGARRTNLCTCTYNHHTSCKRIPSLPMSPGWLQSFSSKPRANACTSWG